MRRAFLCLAGAVLASGTQAQVKGVCVSGCNIPTPPQPQQPEQQQPVETQPQNLIGFPALVRGDVTFVYPSGREVKASVDARTPLSFGTKVITGPDAKVQLMLLDETVFTVGPNSEMLMDEFVYDPSGGFKKVSARVVKGAFRFITGKVAPKDPDRIKVKLNVGDLGIRGTDFEVFADPAGSGEVVLHEGELLFQEYDTDRQLTIRPGQRLIFEDFAVVGVR